MVTLNGGAHCYYKNDTLKRVKQFISLSGNSGWQKIWGAGKTRKVVKGIQINKLTELLERMASKILMPHLWRHKYRTQMEKNLRQYYKKQTMIKAQRIRWIRHFKKQEKEIMIMIVLYKNLIALTCERNKWE